MKIKKTTIKDCLKLELNQLKDFRGSFVKLFSENWFKKIKIKQINFCNFKKKNILRGFHYQIKPYQEIKIVFCIKDNAFLTSEIIWLATGVGIIPFEVLVNNSSSKSSLSLDRALLTAGCVIPKTCPALVRFFSV